MEITSNLRDVLASLGRFEAAGADLSPLMRIFAGMLADTVEENFAQQGRPKWTALSARTIRERQKHGYWPGKILQRRGELARSIHEGHSRNSAWVATNLRYARIHQEGGEIQRAAYGGTVRLRTDRRGNLLRQGPRGTLAIFARARHSQARSVRFETGAFSVKIPARPYFLVPPQDQQRYEVAGARYLQARWGK